MRKISIDKGFIAAGPAAPKNPVAPQSPQQHMGKRMGQGLTQAATGKEFGRSQPTISRNMRQGFIKGGPAR
jgi:hypothetical protein